MVRWAKDVPIHRRRQTAAVLLWMVLMPLCILVYLSLLSYRQLVPYLLAYAVFIALDPSPETGGRRIMRFRRLKLWKFIRDFFPIRLIRTTTLDSTKNYIFCYHPHGIIALGAFVNFGTEANDFEGFFPGINIRVLTLASNFITPIWREILLCFGSVSRRSCESILTQGPGHSCMIVVGGAAEALYAFPGKYDLVLRKRFGFVKIALKHGSHLVPVVAFGETDIWDQVPNPPGSLVRKIQKTFQRIMSFSPPLFHGRGIFQYDVGLIPFRRPITTIVGSPIVLPKIAKPTEEEIQKYHTLYMDSLKALFEQHKNEFAPDSTLQIIE